ncbi:SSI family serine proteinase inhibitor [Streptomyces sp. NPDC006339]|uniref:SSI family serine proteinase inhibitor n=1 Tax=Streptomyces sp. NPDC006339 TaxID=3156755 RepID=UPI0033A77185
MRTKIVATVLGGAFAAILSGTASADPAPTTRLELTIEHPGPEDAPPGESAAPANRRTVVLSCSPAAGSHPRPDRACADLDASEGRIETPPGDVACILLYDPVIATAHGTWQGRPVEFKRQYGNDCEMHAKTRNIFKF